MRAIIKEIEQIRLEMDTTLIHDIELDGSGELGGVIYKGFIESSRRKLDRIFEKYGITPTQVVETCKEWANRELDKGPKTIVLRMHKKDKGVVVEKGFSDTRYFDVIYFIEEIYGNN